MKKTNLSKIRKILVISLTNLGDVILTTPVFTALKENFPAAKLTVVVGPKAEGLLKGSRMVDEVLVYDKRQLTFFKKIIFVWKLRQSKFNLVIDLRNTLIPYLVGGLFRPTICFGKQPLSMRERHLSRLNYLHLAPASSCFDFYSSGDTADYQNILRSNHVPYEQGFIVIAPGAGSYLKRWKLSGFKEAAAHFVKKGLPVILVGSEPEKELGDEIKKCGEACVLNACGMLTLRQLAALLHDARLVLSNDSGVMHLAMEQGAPTVAIFGPTDPAKYARLGNMTRIARQKLKCVPCEKPRCLFSTQYCMEDLSAEEVIGVCEELLRAKS